MERSKAGMKERSPDGLSLPNQNTVFIHIMWYYFTRYDKSTMKCIYVLGLEYKYFLVRTIVRRGVRVEVGVDLYGVEIHVESLCPETPDCELQRRQQALFF